MKTMSSSQGTKRPVNLTLTEGRVEEARHYTDNLSATVDGLLAEFIVRERNERRTRQEINDEVCDALNRFHAEHGSLADEYSTL